MSAYYDAEAETASPQRIQEIQFRKLRKILDWVSNSNPFYKRKLQDHRIDIEEIQDLHDLEKLPFSTKEEFQLDQEKTPPFGTNLSEPLDHFIRYHQTTGTKGKPLRWLETKESWQWRRRLAATALWAAGVRPSDISFFPFSFGPHVAFWGLFEGAQELGALAIAGGGWDTLQRVQFIMDNKVTVICCTPTYALRITEVARENGIDLRDSSLRRLIQAGEPGALVPSIRKKLIEALGAMPYDYSGLTEVGAYGIQCQHQEQAVHVNESEFILEIIDAKTGGKTQDGEIGEMVLTNLGRGCAPSIRFRTGDLAKLKTENCPCGRTYKMLDGGVLGRSDDMIIIRGLNIFPSQIAEVVQRHLMIGEEYQVLVYEKDGMGELKVQIELHEGRKNEQIPRMLRNELRQRFEIRMEVEAVSEGTLQRSDYKSKRFLDKRKEVASH